MKDKEKQIEEMSKADKDLMYLCKLLFKNWDGTVLTVAKTVLEHYQPKLPKDSVVLSREEYERLKHYEWRVTSGVCMTQKEWFDFCNEDSNRRTCLRIEERERERKETTEKILNEIYTVLWDEKTPIANSFVNLDVKIREIATREGIEIKE